MHHYFVREIKTLLLRNTVESKQKINAALKHSVARWKKCIQEQNYFTDPPTKVLFLKHDNTVTIFGVRVIKSR